tara:strand:+ start:791 stop:1474 length:684 start_codon:yes stop_codon:yes gene_type:complete
MKVCVLGSGGFLGKNLMETSYAKSEKWVGVTRNELDLMNQYAVINFFKQNKFDVVIHCAASINQNDETTTFKNITMFENVVRAFSGKLIYFSSGAALRGNPPSDPYGLAKWIIDHRLRTMKNTHILRIWGCYGPHELETRFSAVCKRDKHVIIKRDKYFDYAHVATVCEIVRKCIYDEITEKEINISGRATRLLSKWAVIFGATYEIIDKDVLDDSYINLDDEVLCI